jgi:hypothetical protein
MKAVASPDLPAPLWRIVDFDWHALERYLQRRESANLEPTAGMFYLRQCVLAKRMPF